jgi:LPS O-antigen subunit length determinant protein (WzzB/FepE family)
MDIKIKQEVIDTVCNSLRASKQSLRNQLRTAEGNKKEIIEHQLAEVEEALKVFEYLES